MNQSSLDAFGYTSPLLSQISRQEIKVKKLVIKKSNLFRS